MSAAIVAAGIGAASTAYSVSQQKKAAKNAASSAPASDGAAAANTQSWSDINKVNELNRENQLWAQSQNTQANKDALAQNRANQTSDFGSLTWSQDPTTGAWTQSNTLAPDMQANLDALRQQQGTQIGAMESGFNVNNDVMNAYKSLNDPLMQQSRDRENARLAAMGLNTGSGQAWMNSQQSLNDAQTRNDQNAILQGFNAWKDTQSNNRANLGQLTQTESAWRDNMNMPSYAQIAAPQVAASTVAQPENMTWEANQEQWKRDQYEAVNQANAGSGWAEAGMSVAGALPSIYKAGQNNGWWGSNGGSGSFINNADNGVAVSSPVANPYAGMSSWTLD
jgi:hypothetical protein